MNGSVINNNIGRVGLDVHKDSISACCFTKGNQTFSGEAKIDPTGGVIVRYLNKMSKVQSSLLRTKQAVQEEEMKTGRRDVRMIARCLAYHMA